MFDRLAIHDQFLNHNRWPDWVRGHAGWIYNRQSFRRREPQPAIGRLASARLETAWVINRYRVFITSPRTLDYLSAELEPRARGAISVSAEMVMMSSVSVKSVRPAVGKFRVMHGDQKEAGVLAPGGGPLRVMAGTVLLQYTPPANDPVRSTE